MCDHPLPERLRSREYLASYYQSHRVGGAPGTFPQVIRARLVGRLGVNSSRYKTRSALYYASIANAGIELSVIPKKPPALHSVYLFGGRVCDH